MKNKIRTIVIFLLVILGIIGAGIDGTDVAGAENYETVLQQDVEDNESVHELQDTLGRARNVLIAVGGGITAILLIVCVLMWQKSKIEDPDSRESADWKNRMMKVVVGFVIILLAGVIIEVAKYVALG